MSIFDLSNSESTLSYADQQWNKMWDLWVDGKTCSPYTELMLYQSEVYNGGHAQYFDNTANFYDLKAEVEALLTILPPVLAECVHRCYTAFADTGDITKTHSALFAACDDVFYDIEDQINKLLEAYAATIQL